MLRCLNVEPFGGSNINNESGVSLTGAEFVVHYKDFQAAVQATEHSYYGSFGYYVTNIFLPVVDQAHLET